MSSMFRSMLAVLAVGAGRFLRRPFSVLAPPGRGRRCAQANDRAKFVGAFELVQTEDRDAKTGQWVRTPDFNSNGYIIYAETGHMGVHIQPKVRDAFRRQSAAGEEAQAALRGYTAYFGSFTVNDKERDKYIIHDRFGQMNPGGQKEVRRYYDFVTMPNGSERLILTPPPADGGGKDKATRRLIWQRMADAPLSAEEKKFVGFWRLITPTATGPRTEKKCFTATRWRHVPARRTSSTRGRAT